MKNGIKDITLNMKGAFYFQAAINVLRVCMQIGP